jgi:hypothetical protein
MGTATARGPPPWYGGKKLTGRLFGWWLMAGADLFRKKSSAGRLLVCSKRKAGGWISRLYPLLTKI